MGAVRQKKKNAKGVLMGLFWRKKKSNKWNKKNYQKLVNKLTLMKTKLNYPKALNGLKLRYQ